MVFYIDIVNILQNKHKNNIMTRDTLNNNIDSVSLVVCDLVLDQLSNQKVNGSDLDKFIDLVASGQDIKFQTPTAKFFFRLLVRNWIKTNLNGLHQIIFPPVGLDNNGNPTTNQSKWA